MVTPIQVPETLRVPRGAGLVGVNGNAFAVIAYTVRKLKDAGNDQDVIDAYTREAMSSDYDHLLYASMVYLGLARG